jgi:glyoxalase family protein
MINQRLLGIHHITAITADAQKNIDFHTEVLGLRMVKLTVNFDDPASYHLYFGDELGRPGSVLTYFAWPGAPQGRHGTGQATALSFSIPENAEGFWLNRFKEFKIIFEPPYQRFDEQVITFYNPDGLKLELVAHTEAKERTGWSDGPISEDNAIRGFYGVTVSEHSSLPTSGMLTDSLGFHLINEVGGRMRFESDVDGHGTILDVQVSPGGPAGLVAAGTIHHIAWRTPTNSEQELWRESLAEDGLNVTEIVNRYYFHSIYFREPGGVLFEIATDPPGFTIDEPPKRLGTELKLPPWLEANRENIIRRLPQLELKKVGHVS